MSEISVSYVPQRMALVAWRPAAEDTLPSVIDAAFAELEEHIASGGACGSEEHLVMYPATWGCAPDEQRIGVAIVIADGAPGPGLHLEELPACQVVKMVHRGSYDALREAWGELYDWMDERDLEPANGCWEVYVNSPAEVPEVELETHLLVPLP